MGGAKEDDRFSDLDIPQEVDETVELNEERNDGDSDGEGKSFEDDPAKDSVDAIDDSLELADADGVSNGEQVSEVKNITYKPFQIIAESTRGLIKKSLDKWVEEGNPLERIEATLTMIYLRRRRMYGKALLFAEWLEERKRLTFVERDYASHLDLVAKVYGVDKAEKYIERVPESHRGEVLYRTLLASFVSVGNIKRAEQVFNKIKELGFPMSIFSCNQLLLLYKRLDSKKIRHVLKIIEKENVKPNILTYRILIDSKGREKDIIGMEQVLKSMKADGMEPDFIIKSAVARHYMHGGNREKAEAVLKKMEGNDLQDNRDACWHLLPLYAALGKADDVKRVWKVCELNPCVEDCMAAIEAWGKLGRVEEAEEVFERSLILREKLSWKYYYAMMKVYANNKLLSRGRDLAKRMVGSGCRFDPEISDALMRLYVDCGEVEKADSVLQMARKINRARPLYSSYMKVMEQYSNKGDIHNSEKIFEQLRRSGYVIRGMQYQFLLQAYIKSKTPVYGFRERMGADKVFSRRLLGQLAAHDPFKKKLISGLLD